MVAENKIETGAGRETKKNLADYHFGLVHHKTNYCEVGLGMVELEAMIKNILIGEMRDYTILGSAAPITKVEVKLDIDWLGREKQEGE